MRARSLWISFHYRQPMEQNRAERGFSNWNLRAVSDCKQPVKIEGRNTFRNTIGRGWFRFVREELGLGH